MWFVLREIARAETAMELEYQRSGTTSGQHPARHHRREARDPAHDVIADRYDDASVLFADIAGFTERASQTPPL